ncbi:zinc finger protein 84 [Anopheles gambiae]|uniref:zinc finger protein 84 n=1 Tax=Anopheles gambiae TaxID=7165 RepID=UPI002AC9B9D6|nr:zinc finger protein 84 [Anopheles gambiae]
MSTPCATGAKVECSVCTKVVSSRRASNLQGALTSDHSVVQALAQLAGIELPSHSALEQAWICGKVCYRQLSAAIALQGRARRMFERFEQLQEGGQEVSSAQERISSPERLATVPTDASLQTDELEHIQQSGHKCCGCDFTGRTVEELYEHIAAAHGRENVSPIVMFVCALCHEAFEDYDGLRNHQQWFENSELFVCHLCSCGFITKASFEDHMSGCTERRSLIAKSNVDADSSLKSKVSTAGVKKRSKKRSKKRRDQTKLSTGYACCNATFAEEKDLLDHVQERHAARLGMHYRKRTSDQSVSFRNRKTLRQHRHNRQAVKRQNSCRHCGRRDNIPGRDLCANPSRQFLCEVCGKCFGKQSQLRLHAVSHRAYRLYGCVHCAARFHFAFRLKKHLQSVHASEYRYECPHCGRKMADKARYDLHLRKHMDLTF